MIRTAVVSHELKSIQSTPVENASSILLLGGNTHVVGIDEAQFFDNNCPTFAMNWPTKVSRYCCRFGYGLLGQTLWPYAGHYGHCGIGNQSTCGLRGLDNPALYSYRW